MSTHLRLDKRNSNLYVLHCILILERVPPVSLMRVGRDASSVHSLGISVSCSDCRRILMRVMEKDFPHPLDMMAGNRGRKEGPVCREVQAPTVSAEAFGAGETTTPSCELLPPASTRYIRGSWRNTGNINYVGTSPVSMDKYEEELNHSAFLDSNYKPTITTPII
jgi:hypothetical protein